MKQVVFNSFPRSGNVYSSNCYHAFMHGNCSAVHIPEIFSVNEIANVTLFRKPEDAIASLIYKHSEGDQVQLERSFNGIQSHIDYYRLYMDYAKRNNENIYIGKFDDLINDTIGHFENLSKWLDIPLVEGYKDNFQRLSLSGNVWQEKYDGHMPREKDPIRLELEKAVAKMDSIQYLNEQYQTFIDTYKTVI